ncbi:MAG: DNA repair protein RecO C-terminal domain-containing protein [Acidobacteria bacterium]|nr:DNA repair protein RecO C-terminal domain-containing protein [Acidobacteriota bacterium]
MTRHEDEAIVLEVQERGESDRRVLMMVRSGELVPALAPAGARSRQRFGGALQPGARVRARWTVRREGAEPVLEEAQLLAAPPAGDPLERLYLAAHVLETIGAFAREGAVDPPLYRLLAAALDEIARGAPVDALARYVEAWTLRLAGLLPEGSACAECGAPLAGRRVALAAERGVFCSRHIPAGARVLGPGAAGWLEATRRAGPEALPELAAAHAVELARVLVDLVVSFTGKPLRAWPALARLRGGGWTEDEPVPGGGGAS